MELLRFITCGSVDDGKSTLVGRLLHDVGSVFGDQMATLAEDTHAAGGRGGALDFALLVDGLAAEREQGITIDVAYRYFSSSKRAFIVADTPGHEQYTRNMATGASTADLAVILVDATRGVLNQTRRHSQIVRLMGVRQVVLAVSKMDLVDWSQAVFDAIVADYATFADRIGLNQVHAVPLCGPEGDNVVEASLRTSWYSGPPLLALLEAAETHRSRQAANGPLRLPVQMVIRPDASFRGFAGRVAAGRVRPGDAVRVSPSGVLSRVARIVGLDGDLDQAVAGQSVTLTLADEIDCSRGDMLVAAEAPPEVADQFEAEMVWMAGEPLLPGRPYLLKIGPRTVTAQVTQIKHKLNVDTQAPLAARRLDLNEIGLCNISLSQALPFEPYETSPELGGFILIDRLSNATVAAGMIRFGLRRAHNIRWQALDVTRESRASSKGQSPAVVWFTGLSGAGKSTIANLVEKRLLAEGRHTYLLDGDNVRHGLNRDLGFTEADRVENLRRAAEVAWMMADAGLIVLSAFISPFRADRLMARERMVKGEFFEVFVDVPLAEAEARDVKGLYAKARAGELVNFTGIDSPYEPPESPDLHIDVTAMTAEQAADEVVGMLCRANRLGGAL
ncbi:MAG: sulfate adenylyltransferase subunit CysN [Brevundimonas sp.]|jgi:bifunctional enzyme CysN/CysC|uniref:sulfate adenylyltransferase subunit CysN n=1 Tax=Brevundimonas sp. TaxID=1871086 RepID=UPI0025C1CE67|nr:sulfate adenylyltransferase subunit CysN [Brevundimonas sp.]MCH4268029.1 sulfate adenylyltransferase subunit CysN [Brevundimonas sp.]